MSRRVRAGAEPDRRRGGHVLDPRRGAQQCRRARDRGGARRAGAGRCVRGAGRQLERDRAARRRRGCGAACQHRRRSRPPGAVGERDPGRVPGACGRGAIAAGASDPARPDAVAIGARTAALGAPSAGRRDVWRTRHRGGAGRFQRRHARTRRRHRCQRGRHDRRAQRRRHPLRGRQCARHFRHPRCAAHAWGR